MASHTVERTARGVVDGIRSGCGSDECPVEDHDVDAGTITYTCPVSGDTIVTVDVEDAEVEPANKPATTRDLEQKAKNRRRSR